MVKMTKKAADQFKAVLTEKSLPESTLLRVDVERGAGGPEDLHLALRLDTGNPRHDDKVETTEGARLAVGETIAQALGDGELDFHEDDGAFVFKRAEQHA